MKNYKKDCTLNSLYKKIFLMFSDVILKYIDSVISNEEREYNQISEENKKLINELKTILDFKKENKDFCLGELYKKLFSELNENLLQNDKVNINETFIPFVLKVGKILKSQFYSSSRIKFDDSKNLPPSINHNYNYVIEKFKESQKENGNNNDEIENNNNKKIDEGFNLIISWNSRLESQR